MRWELTADGDQHVITVTGDLDGSSDQRFLAGVKWALRRCTGDVTIDATGVRPFDGVDALLRAAAQTVHDAGLAVRVIAPTGAPRPTGHLPEMPLRVADRAPRTSDDSVRQ